MALFHGRPGRGRPGSGAPRRPAHLPVRGGARGGGAGRPGLAAGPPGAAAEAALQLHRADRHGHQERARAARHAERHLPVHHGAVPLLPGQPAGLAELHPPQPQPQRLLHHGLFAETGRRVFERHPNRTRPPLNRKRKPAGWRAVNGGAALKKSSFSRPARGPRSAPGGPTQRWCVAPLLRFTRLDLRVFEGGPDLVTCRWSNTSVGPGPPPRPRLCPPCPTRGWRP
ncbi:unnamed protein product [Tetraodon nigroviridis]|uniref:(spotted green pufferfish) hypothetical protein n=1 Tax=Tetraodon nigroviridis TaxID=99883 RepID=Q4T3G2_TETNG|nr:unnamed protein product [Tetraodon nigroviridis]